MTGIREGIRIQGLVGAKENGHPEGMAVDSDWDCRLSTVDCGEEPNSLVPDAVPPPHACWWSSS